MYCCSRPENSNDLDLSLFGLHEAALTPVHQRKIINTSLRVRIFFIVQVPEQLVAKSSLICNTRLDTVNPEFFCLKSHIV